MKPNPRIGALKGWVQEQHLSDEAIKKYTKEFQKNKPIQHILIKNFLQPRQIEYLIKALEKQEFETKDSDLFYVQQTKDLRNSTSFVFSSFYTMLNSNYLQKMLQEITGIPKLKNTVDLAALNFPQHGYLLPHDDYLDHRKIAYILYLSPTLTPKDGGALEFFAVDEENVPKKIVKSYPPQQNSLMLFKVTRQSFHQVNELLADKKRLTLGGWFHG
ncbi:2OG-Fe(II) oxygenase [Candidatus Woesearchaeota archaeon]|nr:2OG-Fe(II) oxygenase [Candidatus Woesearchaeota archaeon]